jgi:hypothetical protein
VSAFSKHTVNQTIGQKFTEFFNDNSPNFEFEVTPFGEDLEFVIIRDVSERRNRIQKYESLLERMRPQIAPIPRRTNCIYIDVRVNSEGMMPEEVFDEFDRIEKNHPNVQRISASVSMLKAVTDVPEDAFLLAVALHERFGRKSRIAVTQGIVTLISLADNEAVVIGCGMTVRRAEDCVVHGQWGRVYIDDTVMRALLPAVVEEWKQRIEEGAILEICATLFNP